MIDNLDKNAEIREMSDIELENVVGGYSVGDVVVYKEYTKCPTCRASIPNARLLFYRGLAPNSQRAWIVKTGCCNTTFHCVESEIRPL